MTDEHPGFRARVLDTGDHPIFKDDTIIRVECAQCGAWSETFDAEERDEFYEEHRHGVDPVGGLTLV